MEPKVGERMFALLAPGAFNERLGRRRCQVPASAVDGENARLYSRAGHRCGLTAAVVRAAELRYGVVFPLEKVPRTVIFGRVQSGTQGGMEL